MLPLINHFFLKPKCIKISAEECGIFVFNPANEQNHYQMYFKLKNIYIFLLNTVNICFIYELLFVIAALKKLFFFHSWNRKVQILDVMPNDKKSMWMVGCNSDGNVELGFIVSFSSLLFTGLFLA